MFRILLSAVKNFDNIRSFVQVISQTFTLLMFRVIFCRSYGVNI